jgi:hypothetical protein
MTLKRGFTLLTRINSGILQPYASAEPINTKPSMFSYCAISLRLNFHPICRLSGNSKSDDWVKLCQNTKICFVFKFNNFYIFVFYCVFVSQLDDSVKLVTHGNDMFHLSLYVSRREFIRKSQQWVVVWVEWGKIEVKRPF